MKLYEIVMHFFKNDFELVMIFLVLLLMEILITEWIERNNYKLELKRNTWTVTEAKITRFRVVARSTSGLVGCAIDIEYADGGETKTKRMRTYGKFALEYKYSDHIKIMIVPNSDYVFFYEETWKEINRALVRAAWVILAILVFMLIMLARSYR